MRIPVNLASEPFHRDRPMIVGATVVGLALVGLLGVLTFLSMAERGRSNEARSEIERINRQLQMIAREQTRLETLARQPANAEVLDRSLFLNALLIRKGVSWTRIFSDLEQVTPHNVRLVSVRPQITGQNDLILDMVVASQNVEPVTSFLMQLETSALFGTTTVHNWLPPSQTEPLYRYRVSVNYAQKL